ncbi:uncharacterized protein LOC106154885 [Lingula anatina]|uniref:Uncharacterized protein LOC106154885 n=1 Tax=Lingula anatina TaxID=7574 RepID=A0A1S3HFM2_LINAN|nr:uncharacterized protein LOC106154885 [Lingula anatina]|eukprot:XP_013384877.1 uncharacterized protein LOC106154885 [Lingula anatina]
MLGAKRVEKVRQNRSVVHILRRSAFHLKLALVICEKSKEERTKKAAEIEEQIAKIKGTFSETRIKLNELLDTKAQEAAQQIKDYLKRNSERVITWEEDDCPQPTGYLDLYSKARSLVLGRIRELLEEWNTKTNFFTDAQRELIGKFHIEFNIMDNQVAFLESQLISNDTLEIEDAKPTGLWIVKDTATFSTAQKILLGVTSPIWIPIGLVAALFVIPAGLGIAHVIKTNAFTKYGKNKAEFMNCFAKNVLEYFLSEENLSKEVAQHLNSAVATMNNLLSVIPKLLHEDAVIIKRLLSENNTDESELQLYRKYIRRNEELEGCLGLLYVTKIRENINAKTEISWNAPAFATGTFGEVCVVTLLSRNNVKATAKVMKQFVTAENVCEAIQNEECLRRLTGTPHIANFIGSSAKITTGEKRYLVTLIEHCPTTLADVINPNGRGEVTDRNEVRLADVGLTKPQCDITGAQCETLVYISPEILKKEKYGAPADMYTVGVMLWEMWYGMRVYNLHRFENFKGLSDILEDPRDKFAHHFPDPLR